MKTTPRDYQRECLNLSWCQKTFAVLLEQGLGKTKVVLDTAELLFKKNKIEALLVVAPNGVHSNWIRSQIPIHLDCPYVTLEYDASKVSTKKFKDAVFELLAPPAMDRATGVATRKLRILCANVEAFSTDGYATKLARTLLDKYPTLMAVDESTRIKNPGAQRTKRILALGRRAAYKRILTGTLITQTPFDAYAQFAFLDYDILGFYSYYAFKHQYGVWEKKFAQASGRRWEYEDLIRYQRLDQLSASIAKHSFRRTKAECLDLPPKTYVTYGVSLSPEQRRLYDRVLAEGVIEFDDFRVLTPLQISRLLRCQQITGGFVPTGEESTTRALKDNPKLKLLLDVVSDAQSKTIVWARFQPEIRAIVSALRETYGHESVVEYHGSVTTSQRRESARAFQGDGDVRFFVGQQASGIGIDLYAAEVVYYYSNDFSYEHRYQTEDRAHRIGLVHPVLYVDLVAYDTYDERVRQVLEQARSVADEILEDKKREKVCRQK